MNDALLAPCKHLFSKRPIALALFSAVIVLGWVVGTATAAHDPAGRGRGREPPRKRSRRGGPFRLVGLRDLEAGHVVLRNRRSVCRCRSRLAVSGVHLTSDSTSGIGG